MSYIQIVGLTAGVLTSISLLPQLVKTIKERKVEDLSIVMVLLLIAGISGWLYYGILRDDMPIIFTNAFSLLLNLTMLVLYFIYKKD
ncbi:hypothetical protein BH09BAC2_BH09BAC2_06950 [soil metagenome]